MSCEEKGLYSKFSHKTNTVNPFTKIMNQFRQRTYESGEKDRL